MKPIFRLLLAFLAGTGLLLLLVLLNREAPPPAPELPIRSGRTTRPATPQAGAIQSDPQSRAPRSGPQPASSAGLDGEASEATALPPEPVQSAPLRASAGAGAPVGLGGRYTAKPGSKVRIEGTSNLHDWQVEGNIIGGRAEFGTGFPSDPNQVQTGPVQAAVQASIPVRSLKSINLDGTPFNAKMDDIMYGLLLEPAFKSIQFTLEELTLTDGPQAEGRPFAFTSRGELMVAGVTNSITLPVEMTLLPGDKLKFSGALSVRMTDFGIQPPRPLNLGITTGDDVRLSFEWIVGRKPPEPTSP